MIDTGHRRCQGTSPSWPFSQTLILVFEKPVGLFGIMQDVASSFSFPKELVASFSPTVQVKSVKLHGRTHAEIGFFLSILTRKVEVGDVPMET